MTDTPPKPITITLTWYIKDYKVAATTNYLGHRPGDWISPQEAAEMNARPGWTVITADNQLLSELTGAVITNVVKAIPIPTI